MVAPRNLLPAERLARIEAIVSRLPQPTRGIFLASRLETVTHEQIAQREGISVREVERHIARALTLIDRGLERAERPWWKLW